MQSTSKRFARSLVLFSALFASVLGGVAHAAAGDPSQWGAEMTSTVEVAKKGSFDISEAAAAEHELLASNGTSKGGDVPVTTGRKVNEYEGQHRLAGGKDPEIPVTSG